MLRTLLALVSAPALGVLVATAGLGWLASAIWLDVMEVVGRLHEENFTTGPLVSLDAATLLTAFVNVVALCAQGMLTVGMGVVYIFLWEASEREAGHLPPLTP